MITIKSTFGSYFVAYNEKKYLLDTTKKPQDAAKFASIPEAEEQIKKLKTALPQYGWSVALID